MSADETQVAILSIVDALNESSVRTAAFMLTVSQLLVKAGVCTDEQFKDSLDTALEAVREEHAMAETA